MEYIGVIALEDDLFALGLLTGVLLVGGGIGLKIIRWVQVNPASYLETLVFSVPIGLGIFSLGILALGLSGLLESWVLILWFVACFFWSFQEWWELGSAGLVKFISRCLSV